MKKRDIKSLVEALRYERSWMEVEISDLRELLDIVARQRDEAFAENRITIAEPLYYQILKDRCSWNGPERLPQHSDEEDRRL